jgi:hypothetical protein
MRRIFLSMVCPALVFPILSAHGDEKGSELNNGQKAKRALANKEIRPDLPPEKMLDLCVPSARRTIGRFTEYEYELLPGYCGLTIIAKDGRLKRAIEWGCTDTQIYFDELAPDDEKQYRKVRKEVDVPYERLTAHWGWERPRMRDWKRGED